MNKKNFIEDIQISTYNIYANTYDISGIELIIKMNRKLLILNK